MNLFLDHRFGELGNDLPDHTLDDLARERDDRVGLGRRESELGELSGEVTVDGS